MMDTLHIFLVIAAIASTLGAIIATLEERQSEQRECDRQRVSGITASFISADNVTTRRIAELGNRVSSLENRLLVRDESLFTPPASKTPTRTCAYCASGILPDSTCCSACGAPVRIERGAILATGGFDESSWEDGKTAVMCYDKSNNRFIEKNVIYPPVFYGRLETMNEFHQALKESMNG